ncbi:unnamed protein product [Penicillium camemberti]|uniref:Str. FM013 n=1 Tax=Penicillium camemberti (strain FM 013) TaxID=1429867 RepID=A0A0G4NZQ0_PENC3|nr:unnamed protein product [Penicillium camemberti]
MREEGYPKFHAPSNVDTQRFVGRGIPAHDTAHPPHVNECLHEDSLQKASSSILSEYHLGELMGCSSFNARIHHSSATLSYQLAV